MTDTSASTSSYVDVTCDTWDEYFGETEGSETIVDILNYTEEEWGALIEKYGIDIVSGFRSDFATELDEKDFQTLIDGTKSTLEESNQDANGDGVNDYDSIIEDLDALSESCDLEALDDAITEYSTENVDLESQTSTTFTEPSDVETGTTYTYTYYNSLETFYWDVEEGTTVELAYQDPDTGEYMFRCTKEDGTVFYVKFVKGAEASDASESWVTDPHPDWYDSNGDGIGDTPIERDEEGNLITDLNNDDLANEEDEALLRDGGDSTFNIIFTGSNGNITETEVNSWPEELARHMYQSQETYSSGYSAYYLTHPDEYEETTGVTNINLEDCGNTTSLDLTTTSYGDDITIYCQNGITDTININFPPDAVVTYSVDESGNLVITATFDGQTITITVVGWQTDTDSEGHADVINISGGTGTVESVLNSLMVNSSGQAVSVSDTYTYTSDEWEELTNSTLASIIYLVDGEPTGASVADVAYSEGMEANTADQEELDFPSDFPDDLEDAIEEAYDHMSPEDQAAFAEWFNENIEATMIALTTLFNFLAADPGSATQTNLNSMASACYAIFAKYFGSNTELMDDIKNWLEEEYSATVTTTTGA